MRPDIFQKALLATARVACCAALLSCAPRTEEKKTNTSPPSLPISIAPESKPTPPASTSAPTSANTLGECDAHVKSVYVSKAISPNEHTKECCQKIAESVGIEGVSSWNERDQCCKLVGWYTSPACSPWGPPCPPSMGVV